MKHKKPEEVEKTHDSLPNLAGSDPKPVSENVVIRSKSKFNFTPAPELSRSDIKQFRKSLNLTQDELSELLMVHVTSIKKWESGENVPLKSTLRLFQALKSYPEFIELLKKSSDL